MDVGRLVSDVVYVRGIFERLRREYDRIGMVRSKINGLIEGNRPFDTQRLIDEGLGWYPNINTREAENTIERQVTKLWELETDVPVLITLDMNDLRYLENRFPVVNYIGIIEEEYSRLLRRWSGYDLNRQMVIREKVKYGISGHFWDDEYDFRFKPLKASNIYFPRDSEVDIDRLDLFFIWHSYRANELYSIIESGDIAESEGWNLGLLKKVVMSKVWENLSDSERLRVSDWEAIQRVWHDNLLGLGYIGAEPVVMVDMYIKDGGVWSRYRFTDRLPEVSDDEDGFVMVNEGLTDDITHIVAFDYYCAGDGTIHSIKGLGHRIYNMFDTNNRLTSATLASAMISSSLMLQSLGRNTNISIVRRGPITIVPENTSIVQSSFVPNIDSLIGVRNMMLQILSANTGVYKTEDYGGWGGSRYKSAKEVTIEAMNRQQVGKVDAVFHYIFRDIFHREMFRRVMRGVDEIPNVPAYRCVRDEIKLFYDRCVARGVPKEMMDYRKYSVSATRALGFGSPLSREQITASLLEVLPFMDEIGKRNVISDRVASLVGYGMASRYIMPTTRDAIPTNETSLAVLENNDLRSGNAVVVGVDQMHDLHIKVHLALGDEFMKVLAEPVPKVSDGVAMKVAFELLIKHIEMHLQHIAGRKDMEDFVKFVLTVLSSYRKGIEVLDRIIRRQLQEAQEMAERVRQMQLENEELRRQTELVGKMKEVETNAYVKMQDKIMQNEIRQARLLADTELKRYRAEADMDIKRQKMEKEVEIKRAKELNKGNTE